jgi:hypothetical protein
MAVPPGSMRRTLKFLKLQRLQNRVSWQVHNSPRFARGFQNSLHVSIRIWIEGVRGQTSVEKTWTLGGFGGRALAQAVSRWLPTAGAWVRVFTGMWGLSWTEAGFFPSTSVFPVNHSTNFSNIIITRGWHNRPIDGRSAEWTQLVSMPPLYQFNLI